jgi:outer membrane protein TolC
MNTAFLFLYQLNKLLVKRKVINHVAPLSILLWIMLSIVAIAQKPLTLSEAINKGLANKKSINAARVNIDITNLQMQALYRKYGPQVSGEYTYHYNPILQTSILPIGLFNPAYPADATINLQFGTKWTQSAGLTVIQPLMNLGLKPQINEARIQGKLAEWTQEQSVYELAYTIAKAYLDICLDEAKIKTLIADTGRTYLSYTLLKNKYDEKRLLKSDVNTASINHNQTIQLLADGVALLAEDKMYLHFLMGATEMEPWNVEVVGSFCIPNSIADKLYPIDAGQLPDLQRLSLQSKLASQQAASEKAKHMPTIDFKGFLGANQFSNTFNPVAADTWFGLSYLGVDVKIPLLDGENQRNKIAQLKLQASQFDLEREDKALAYTKDVWTAKFKWDHAKTQLVTREENIRLSLESIQIFQERVKEGQESAANLNLEASNLLVLETDYETSKRQLCVYWLDYLKAAGQLTLLWK